MLIEAYFNFMSPYIKMVSLLNLWRKLREGSMGFWFQDYNQQTAKNNINIDIYSCLIGWW